MVNISPSPSADSGINMARPRKNGERPLPPNLYEDNRKRPNHYRYKNANGTFKPIIGSYQTVCEIAEEANRLRESPTFNAQKIGSFPFWLEKYIEWKESFNPSLQSKASWSTRKNLLTKFCDDNSFIKPKALQLTHLETWWESLTCDQQHNRRSEFSYFFQWMLGKGAVTFNPFTTADDQPRLFEKPKPKRSRMRLDVEGFWGIYEAAGTMGLDYDSPNNPYGSGWPIYED